MGTDDADTTKPEPSTAAEPATATTVAERPIATRAAEPPTATTITRGPSATDVASDLTTPGAELERGALVDRYVVLGRAGRGGMGVVYQAYDPKLDRKIALKRVRRIGQAADRARLMREAQAMARLSHPNVVNVYDAIEHDGRLFIAMEWIEGRTLSRWLADEPRSWRAILAIFVQAARGLAAAHRAGIVHRDFKPANVLVGVDERARVTDFGIARVRQSDLDDDTSDLTSSGDATSESAETLTGRVVGTYRYMAPEQLHGATDERSDQFSFCVALYEALYRGRVTDGLDPPRAPEDGGRKLDLPKSAVPRRIGRAIQRGLSYDPSERFPSIDALAAALTPTTRRASIWAVLGALVASAAVVTATVYTHASGARRCRDEAALLTGVWDDAVRAETRAAFEATGRKYSAEAFASVSHALDARAERLVSARREACEATHLRGEQSEEMLDARTACLDQRLAEMRAFTTGLRAGVDPDAADDIVTGARTLPAIDTCARSGGGKRAPPAEDDEEKERRAHLRATLAEVAATHALGRFEQALEIARGLAADAEKTTDPSLRVDSLEGLALALRRGGEREVALDAFYRVAREAAAANRNDVEAAAWNNVILLLGYKLARFEQALLLQPVAEAALARLDDDRYERADMLHNLAVAHYNLGHYEEAERMLTRALELERAVSPQELSIGHTLTQLGLVVYARGRFEEAQHIQEQAIEHWDRTLGKDHPYSASSMIDLASALRAAGRPTEARPYLERAIEIWDGARGPSSVSGAAARNNLALLLLGEGEVDDAIAEFERALARYEAGVGPDHPDLGYPLLGLASAYLAKKRPRQAQKYAERALHLWQKKYGEDHPMLAWAHAAIGNALLAEGDPRGAVPPLERALSIWEESPPPPEDLGDVQFALARALFGSHANRARSLALARTARETFARAGERAPELVKPVEKWLSRPH